MGYDNEYYNVAAAPDVNEQARLVRRDRWRHAATEVLVVAAVSAVSSFVAVALAWLVIYLSNGGSL